MTGATSAKATTSQLTLVDKHGIVSHHMLDSAILAYRIIRPDVTFSSTADTRTSVFSSLINNKIDYTVVGDTFSADELAPFPDIVSFPCSASAVAPIYNLPGIPENGDNTKGLIISGIVLAQIFMGEIKLWNDTRLTSINPHLTLPDKPITIVTNSDAGAQTLGLTRGLSQFYAPWAAKYGITNQVNWPIANYSAYIPATEITGPSAHVLANPYSFSYAFLSVAYVMQSNVARMVNKAGQIVIASSESVMYAFTELGAHVDASGKVTWQPDLTDASGVEAWPLTMAFGVYMPASAARSTCAAKKEIVLFWRWFVTSEIVKNLIREELGAVLSPLLYVKLDLDNFFFRTIECDGASIEVGSANSIRITGPPVKTLYSDVLSLYVGAWSSTDAIYNYQQVDTGELQTLAQVSAGEVSAGVIYPDTFRVQYPGVLEAWTENSIFAGGYSSYTSESAAVAATTKTGAIDEAGLAVIPYALYSVVITYHLPPAADAYFEPHKPLLLDLETLAGMMIGTISNWTDPAIVRLNPALTYAFNRTVDSTIRPVYCCSATGARTMGGDSLIQLLNTTNTVKNADPLITSSLMSLPADWSSVRSSLARKGRTSTMVATELQMESSILGQTGSIGYELVAARFSDPEHEVRIVKKPVKFDPAVHGATWDKWSPAQKANPNLKGYNILAAEPENVANCALATNPATAGLSLLNAKIGKVDVNSQVAGNVVAFDEATRTAYTDLCYPLTFLSSIVTPTAFASPANGVCEHGNRTVNMVHWLTTSRTLETAAHVRGITRFSNFSVYSTLITAQMQQITCDKQTLLITRPTYWSISAAISSLGSALAAIGIIVNFVSLILILIYKSNSIIKSSHWQFLLTVLAGLTFLYGGIAALTASSLGNASCQAMTWMVNLGVTCMFLPIWAKEYRIYKLFDARVLRMVKISNGKLSIFVAAMVGVDFLFLIIWQAYAPVTAVGYSDISSSGSGTAGTLKTTIYNECGADSKSVPFFAIAAGAKGLLVLSCLWMAVSTRAVPSQHNEMRNIAWSIYNTIFAIGITVPILFFAKAHGDSRIILILFLVFWATFCAWVCIFLTKFILIFKPKPANAALGAASALSSHMSQSRVSHTSGAFGSMTNFSFPSIAMIPKAQLEKYVYALEGQLKLARTRRVLIAAGGSGGSNLGSDSMGHSQGDNSMLGNDKANDSNVGANFGLKYRIKSADSEVELTSKKQ